KKSVLAVLLLFSIIEVAHSNTGEDLKGTYNQRGQGNMKITKEYYGTTNDGQKVYQFTMVNRQGMVVKIITYGGAITEIITPDRNGKPANVVLGYRDLEGYLKGKAYFGAIIGRYANRIGKAEFWLDGVKYKLVANENGNQLHGGPVGFDKRVWKARRLIGKQSLSLLLTYTSKDGEEGYPGTVHTSVKYTLNNNNELQIEYRAVTDKPTVINLTNHSYFNLSGDAARDILGEEMLINGDYFTPVDSTLIPTGEIRKVDGTPMDFRKLTPIGARINDNYEQLKFGHGYDHNWVLNKNGHTLSLAAMAVDPVSGRTLQVFTTEPGIQFYSGNVLDEHFHVNADRPLTKRFGFCLETQHFPDSPNKLNFPSVVLIPGKTYFSKTIFRFGIK
ncbi:MAG: aldose epimerase family protein, partial [Candidatus Kryptoniota bacterium]